MNTHSLNCLLLLFLDINHGTLKFVANVLMYSPSLIDYKCIQAFCWLGFQAQLVVLASQVSWSESVENALASIASSKNPSDLTALSDVLQVVENTLNVLADSVLLDQPPVRRKKMEHLVGLNVSSLVSQL